MHLPMMCAENCRRTDESPLESVSEIAELAVDALKGLKLLGQDDDGIPCFFFGHELGALVAFEMCRRFEDDFPVAGLFVSGMSCPQV